MRHLALLAISCIILAACQENGTPSETAVSATQTLPPTNSISDPTPSAVQSPVEAWEAYANDSFGFGFRYPADIWSLVDRPNLVSLVYKDTGIALRIGYKYSGEEIEIPQYGGAAGEFVSVGQVNFLGQDIEKETLIFQGDDKEVHYNNTREISRGDLLFTLAIKSNRNFEQAVVPNDIQSAADEVLATFVLLGVQE